MLKDQEREAYEKNSAPSIESVLNLLILLRKARELKGRWVFILLFFWLEFTGNYVSIIFMKRIIVGRLTGLDEGYRKNKRRRSVLQDRFWREEMNLE